MYAESKVFQPAEHNIKPLAMPRDSMLKQINSSNWNLLFSLSISKFQHPQPYYADYYHQAIDKK